MLEKILRWGAIVGIFCLPFIVFLVSRSLFFPYITGKNFTFRILVELIGGMWLTLALIYPAYRPRRSWILLAFTAFVVVIGLADAFGVNPAKSIWSNFERMDGWVTLAHLFVYFLAAVSLLTTELWKRWWQVSLGVATLVAFHGVFQLIGLADISTQSGSRLDGTFGNATYLAVYMLFYAFIAAFMLAREWTERRPGERMGPALLYGGMMALFSFVLFYTATRGAILGLIGGAVLAALLLIVLAPRSRVAWRAGVVVGSVILLVGGFWLVRDTSFVRSIGPLERLASISISDRTVESRFMNAAMAWQGFKERPLLGWGQENYAVVFDKYYNPQMYAQEPWFDRVHNVIFDWLVAGGALGLLAYLSLYVAALFALWRSGAFEPAERSILTGLLAAYFFYLLFTFDNIFSAFLFVAVLAYIATRASKDRVTLFVESALPKKVLPIVAVVAVFVTIGVVRGVNADAIAANRALILALSSHPEGYEKNLDYFKEAISYDSFGTQEAREHLSQAAARIADPQLQASSELRLAFLETAAGEMRLQMEESPLNARFPLFLGILLNAYGAYPDAQVALEKARELSPKKQSILFELGLNALARGESDEALRIFEEAYSYAPEYSNALVLLVAAHIQSGNLERAEEFTPQLLEAGVALDPRVLAAYAARERYDKIAALAEDYIRVKPQESQPYLTLAAARYQSQDHAGAIAALEQLKAAVPQATAQADALIESIRKGVLQVQ